MPPHSERLYGSIAAAKAVGISLRQLYYWVSVQRVVHPRVRQRGMRRFRYFTSRDLKTLQAVQRLIEHGYTLQAAVRMARGPRASHRD